jgi:hypothetical protein
MGAPEGPRDQLFHKKPHHSELRKIFPNKKDHLGGQVVFGFLYKKRPPDDLGGLTEWRVIGWDWLSAERWWSW